MKLFATSAIEIVKYMSGILCFSFAKRIMGQTRKYIRVKL